MECKKLLVKIIISIGENWLNKKTTPSITIPFFFRKPEQQDCSYEGKDLKFPTDFSGLWSSNNMKKNYCQKNELFF